MDPRTRLLLEAPIAATLARLALPNVLVIGAQACAGLIETYFIGGAIGGGRWLYGATGASLDAALTYSNVVFAGFPPTRE